MLKRKRMKIFILVCIMISVLGICILVNAENTVMTVQETNDIFDQAGFYDNRTQTANGVELSDYTQLNTKVLYGEGSRTEFELSSTKSFTYTGFGLRVPQNSSSVSSNLYGQGRGLGGNESGYGITLDLVHERNDGKIVLGFNHGNMEESTLFKIDYPSGFDVTTMNKFTIDDFGDSIKVYINKHLFINIAFGDVVEGMYVGGTVYDASGNSLGTFTQSTYIKGCVAFYARLYSKLTIKSFVASSIEPVMTVQETNDIFDQAGFYDNRTQTANGVELSDYTQLNTKVLYGEGSRTEFELSSTKSFTYTGFGLRVPQNSSSVSSNLYGQGRGLGGNESGYGITLDLVHERNDGKIVLGFNHGNMEESTLFKIDYPSGFDVTTMNKFTIDDFGDSIKVYINKHLFINIAFGDVVEGMYVGGTVYDASGNSLGTFTQKTYIRGCIAFYARLYSKLTIKSFAASSIEPVMTVGETNDIFDKAGYNDNRTQTANGVELSEYTQLNTKKQYGTEGDKAEFELSATKSFTYVGFGLRVPVSSNLYGLGRGLGASEAGYGITFDIVHEKQPDQIVIGFNFGQMSESKLFNVNYPNAFNVTSVNKFTVEDFGSSIKVYINGSLFVTISFNAIEDGKHKGGTLLDASGNSLGTFSQDVHEKGSIALYARSYSTVTIKSFKDISKAPENPKTSDNTNIVVSLIIVLFSALTVIGVSTNSIRERKRVRL